jgi:hypothetical protein
VEILEDQQERLLARFSKQQSLHGVQRALARVDGLPGGVVHGHVQQGQQGWQRGLERAVEGEHLAGHLLTNLAKIVAVLDLEVALEQVDHGQVAGGLAVGEG